MKKIVVGIVLVLIGILIYYIIFEPIVNRPRASFSKLKHCMANMKVIEAAFEMNNMDENPKYKKEIEYELDKEYETFSKRGYLKRKPECRAKGKYFIKNNIARCSKHGTCNKPINKSL